MTNPSEVRPRIERLSLAPQYRDEGTALLEEYLRLPDALAWLGHVTADLPPVLADAVSRYPGEAVPPGGDVVMALQDERVAGQAMLVPHDASSGRVERMYVRPRFRRCGVATALTRAIVDLARDVGYDRLVLDVIPERRAAIGLYERHGFGPIEPYAKYHLPMIFMGRDLRDA